MRTPVRENLRPSLLAVAVSVVLLFAGTPARAEENFRRDILPILSRIDPFSLSLWDRTPSHAPRFVTMQSSAA